MTRCPRSAIGPIWGRQCCGASEFSRDGVRHQKKGPRDVAILYRKPRCPAASTGRIFHSRLRVLNPCRCNKVTDNGNLVWLERERGTCIICTAYVGRENDIESWHRYHHVSAGKGRSTCQIRTPSDPCFTSVAPRGKRGSNGIPNAQRLALILGLCKLELLVRARGMQGLWQIETFFVSSAEIALGADHVGP